MKHTLTADESCYICVTPIISIFLIYVGINIFILVKMNPNVIFDIFMHGIALACVVSGFMITITLFLRTC